MSSTLSNCNCESYIVIIIIYIYLFIFIFLKNLFTQLHLLYINYLVAGITSRHYSILTVHYFGIQYTYKYMQTTVIATNGITTYLYIQNHTARNISIAHKFVNVILIHSCKTASYYCLILSCLLKIVKAILCKQGTTSVLVFGLVYNSLLSPRFSESLNL